MNCPYCDSELKEGSFTRYQNSIEHVENPNKRPSEKSTWVCKSPTCALSAVDVFWDEFGDFYTSKYWYSEEFKESKSRISELLLNGTTAPGNSLALKLNLEDRARNEKARELSIGKFKYYIQKNFTFSESGKLLKKRYTLIILKRDGVDAWCGYQGFWRMLFYRMGRFHKDVKRYVKGELASDYYKKKLLEEFAPLDNWEKKDNYRKVYNWYVNTFFKGLKKELEYDL